MLKLDSYVSYRTVVSWRMSVSDAETGLVRVVPYCSELTNVCVRCRNWTRTCHTARIKFTSSHCLIWRNLIQQLTTSLIVVKSHHSVAAWISGVFLVLIRLCIGLLAALLWEAAYALHLIMSVCLSVCPMLFKTSGYLRQAWKQTLPPSDSDTVLYVSECLIVNIWVLKFVLTC